MTSDDQPDRFEALAAQGSGDLLQLVDAAPAGDPEPFRPCFGSLEDWVVSVFAPTYAGAPPRRSAGAASGGDTRRRSAAWRRCGGPATAGAPAPTTAAQSYPIPIRAVSAAQAAPNAAPTAPAARTTTGKAPTAGRRR